MIQINPFTSDKSSKLLSYLILQIKKLKLEKFNFITALILFLSLFILVPDFLSIIWPPLQRNISQTSLYIITIVFVNTFIMFLYSISMYFVYIGKYRFFEQYRISKQPWLWETDKKAWYKLLKKTIINILFNSFIIGPIILILDVSNGLKVNIKLQQAPISKYTYLWQFCIFLLANQIWSYLMHILIHHPKLYWIHKQHHQYNIPVSISGLYVHPIQYIISSSISTGLGYKILSNFYPVHIFSLIIWLIFRMIEINDNHCGYNWPWIMSSILPFNCGQNYHYFHHRLNMGNYSGILYFMDSIFGTNKEFWIYQDKIREKYGNQQKIIYGKQ